MSSGCSRPPLLWCLMLGITLVLVLLCSEALLRALGRTPSQPLRPPPNEPVLFEPDPSLGWKSKAGTYVFPAYASDTGEIRMSYASDGSRSTGSRGAGARRKLALVGGSFVQGWGLSDHETLAWKLQERRPELRVVNYGTAAYGTYQALLVLERAFSRPDPPRLVAYGFILDHERRNVAAPDWLEALARSARSSRVSVPFATLDESHGLSRHPPEHYPAWPLRGRLALVSFAERIWLEMRAASRVSQARRVTKKLLWDMNQLCARHQARLIVVFLSRPRHTRAAYSGFLAGQGIRVADCARRITPDRTIPGEGHPNGELNTLWADCLSENIAAARPLP